MLKSRLGEVTLPAMGKNKKQPVGPQDRMSSSELSVSSSFNQRSLSPATAPVFHLVGSIVCGTSISSQLRPQTRFLEPAASDAGPPHVIGRKGGAEVADSEN